MSRKQITDVIFDDVNCRIIKKMQGCEDLVYDKEFLIKFFTECLGLGSGSGGNGGECKTPVVEY